MAYLSITVVDTNSKTIALTGEEAFLIKYHSDAEATMELKQGVANLDTCIIENGNERVYEMSHTFYNVESNEFLFACADADNISHEERVTVPMVDYVKPTCSFANALLDGDGNLTLSCKGNSFNGSFGAVTNEIHAYYRYKRSSDSSFSAWYDMDIETYEEGGYYASISDEGFDYQENWIFEVKVEDELEEVTARKTISGKPVFHWGKSDFTFEVPVNAKDIRLKSDGSNYGHYLRFGDRDYCYIAELADDEMTINASKIILKTQDRYYDSVEGSLTFGEWEPVLDEGAISNEVAMKGWYSKVGQSVTIGFYIKVASNSGYTDTPIVISNLPYTPLYSAAGGGMCSGAYVAGGYNFQCFVAETDGTITTRVQKCNNTSDGRLTTSASGCNYPDTNVITLSGTITYITEELTEE